jgi:glucosamine--fructose-6-phosphate aminotransferase (isomerizing)
MCGIIGYIGEEEAAPILMRGLKRMEYRGYDSAGIALLNINGIEIHKAKGPLKALESQVKANMPQGLLGIGHTRWATHGEPSNLNSHPHTDVKGEIAVVHNGIIENYLKLKNWLLSEGCEFVSETDTEVVAHLLNYYDQGDLLRTIYMVLPKLQGSYALGILSSREPERLYCARKDSPLVLAKAGGASILASDISALLEHSRDIYLLDNMDVACLTRDDIVIRNGFGQTARRDILHVDWTIESAEKDGFEHFMLKEIHEEPNALRKTLNPHLDINGPSIRQDGMPISAEEARQLRKITILACGTAWHAGMIGRVLLEKLARVPVETDIASEFRYRDPIVSPGDLFIIVSQSGETADSIEAMREARKRGGRIIAVTNVVGSSLAREADAVLYTWAGPEIAVASTKAYTSQIMMLTLLALDIAQKRGLMTEETVKEALEQLQQIPDQVERVLARKEMIQRFANQTFDCKNIFFMGRSLDYALAMEASLKLKEISYIHSEAYAAGELKHGTIALIEPGTQVVMLATQEALLEKTLNNIKEVKVRGAQVLAVVTEGNEGVSDEVDEVWYIPKTHPLFAPMIAIIPMQLFAYYVALEKGCDIDKPRNLAKSVTVE